MGESFSNGAAGFFTNDTAETGKIAVSYHARRDFRPRRFLTVAEKNIFDSLQASLADAVKDIREKVVEEPMYGRTLSGPEVSAEPAPAWPQAQEPQPDQSHAQNIEQERGKEQDIER